MENPAKTAIEADLAAPRFLVGVARRNWNKESFEFPVLVITVAATEPDGTASEYGFHFELTGYPGIAPEVHIWDLKKDQILPPELRPKGSPRVVTAFQEWGDRTVYRPWERHGAVHNNWTGEHPDLAWHPKRDLTFILEDLHGLLNSNALTHSARPSA